MKNIIIIGIGRFGAVIAKELSQSEYEILAIDQNPDRIQKISSYVTHAVQANFTDSESLKALGINQFDIGIIGIGKNLYDNLAAAHILKKYDVSYIIAKAKDNLHGELLKKIGVNKIVYPEKTIGNKVVSDIHNDNL